MPKCNSLLEERFFLAAAIFCHDKYLSQKDHVRETLARGTLDLHHELLKMRGAFVARHRSRKQVSIKAKPRKTACFWATVSWRQGQRHVYSAVACDGQFEKLGTGRLIKWLETLGEENRWLFISQRFLFSTSLPRVLISARPVESIRTFRIYMLFHMHSGVPHCDAHWIGSKTQPLERCLPVICHSVGRTSVSKWRGLVNTLFKVSVKREFKG